MKNQKNMPNRLIDEKSPYLLQHAHNPVNWHPWGKEAFEKAKKEDKPIFLSIGYSTCHWCHVMAHESFEDEQVAEVLNRHFVCIKVDREERPDVDAVYMAACQALTGSGGWPLTILMTADQKPFWAGTYLPKQAHYGRIGLLDLLAAIIDQWETNRKKLLEAGDLITEALQIQIQPDPSHVEPTKQLLQSAAALFQGSYDKKWGGFGPAPKFPAAHNLLFLLRYAVLEGDTTAQEMAEHTLIQMFRGGICDHIGGGFSRYSTDGKWLVPHFEKMLYDNALLAYTYLEAYEITNRSLYRTIAQAILDYVLWELTDHEGGFYCGQDADSDGIEGKYYVFTPEEIEQVLGKSAGSQFCQWYNITPEGNFEGKSIPNLLENECYEETDAQMNLLRRKLYDYRLRRTALHKDDKVLTSWNALMIMAFAKAGRLLDEPNYSHAAETAHHFITKYLVNEQGRLMLRWRDGQAAQIGQLDDYSSYALSLLEFYRSTFHVEYLQKAIHIAEQMLDLFYDEAGGGFYLYGKDAEQLINRPKEIYDGAMPSGNSMAAAVLESLSRLTGEKKWRDACHEQFRFMAGMMNHYPAGHSACLLALMGVLYPSQELICATAEQDPSEHLKAFLRDNSSILLSVLVKNKENQNILAEIAPFTCAYPIPERGTTYYLCHNGTCHTPVQNLDDLIPLLK